WSPESPNFFAPSVNPRALASASNHRTTGNVRHSPAIGPFDNSYAVGRAQAATRALPTDDLMTHRLGLLCLFLLTGFLAAGEQVPKPPVAAVKPHDSVLHGEKR